MATKLHLSKIFYTFIIILVVLTAGTAITRFFDISLEAYVPYLTWILALAIFFAILPSHVGKIFLKE